MLPIAILGGTGNLARPVVRRLIEAGAPVRVLTRDPVRAARLLPPEVRCVSANIRDADSVARAADGCAAVYVNLSNPMSQRVPDPDVIGTASALQAARLIGATRLLRISALGVSTGDRWWVAARKAQADAAVSSGGVPFTIFRPAWFMESLPMFIIGRRFIIRMASPMRTHWIAGDDYARQVIAALRTPRAINRIYDVQGPVPMTLPLAVREFARHWSPRLTALPMPAAARRVMRAAIPPLAYLDELLAYYTRAEQTLTSLDTWAQLGSPQMTIGDYVRYALQTRDVPRKGH